MSLANVFLALADNGQSTKRKAMERILQSDGYRRYRDRWNRPILYALFLMLCLMKYLLDFCSVIFSNFDQRATLLRPEKICDQKSFAALFGIDLEAINRARSTECISGIARCHENVHRHIVKINMFYRQRTEKSDGE